MNSDLINNTLNNKLDFTIATNNFSFTFWSKIFSENELNLIKEFINNNERGLHTIVKSLIPAYHISNTFNIYNKTQQTRTSYDINKSKSILAGIFLLFGVLTYKFIITNQDYAIIVKGGKAMQLILSQKPNATFSSDDIDILLMPLNINYNNYNIKILSQQITLLIKWIFNVSNNKYEKMNHVQDLQYINKAYPYINKISYKNQPLEYDSAYYTAMVDIDFGPINNIMFYEDLDITSYEHPELGKIIYKYQNINKLFLEKMFYLNYYAKYYEHVCYNPQIYYIDPKYFNDSYRFIIKFAKQINVLIIPLDKKLYNNRNTSLDKFNSIKYKLLCNFINNNIFCPVNELIEFVLDTQNKLNNLRCINML